MPRGQSEFITCKDGVWSEPPSCEKGRFTMYTHIHLCFTQAVIDHLLLSDTRYSDCFSHLGEGEPRNWLRAMYQSKCAKSGIGTGNWHRVTENIERLNIEASNFIYIGYRTKLFGTLKWHRSNRNIEPCDFEVSSFNCKIKLTRYLIFSIFVIELFHIMLANPIDKLGPFKL